MFPVYTWNLAYAHLGKSSNIADPDEISAEANAARAFYPHEREKMLARHDWGFASVVVALAEVIIVDPPPAPFLDAVRYGTPSDCVRATSVDSNSYAGMLSTHFIRQMVGNVDVIYSTIPDVRLTYVSRSIQDNFFPPGVSEALALSLASKLAGAIIKNTKTAAYLAKEAEIALRRAMVVDANQTGSRFYANHVAPWLSGAPRENAR